MRNNVFFIGVFLFLFSACVAGRKATTAAKTPKAPLVLPVPAGTEAVVEVEKPTPPPPPPPPQINYDTVLLMHWQQHPCLAKCPSYEVFFYASGKTVYRGYADVDTLGELNLRLDSAQLQGLVAKAVNQGFLGLPEQFPQTGNLQNLPSLSVRIRWKNQQKELRHYYAGPIWLERWEKEVERFYKRF